MATDQPASQSREPPPLALVLWLGAAICGIACVYYLLVHVDLTGTAPGASPVLHCGSVVSHGPAYEPEGGDCSSEVAWHQTGSVLLGAGCVLLLGVGTGAAVRQHRRRATSTTTQQE
ncbi:MAG: hypothetical protein ACJ74O_17825 [Frankiaceae bacterium]